MIEIIGIDYLFNLVLLEVIVLVGCVCLMLKEMMLFVLSDVLLFDKKIDDFVDFYVGDKLIVWGEL